MSTLIFDIETIGEDFDSLDELSQEALTRWIKKTSRDEQSYEAALENIKGGMGLSPWTGEIISLGLLDYEKDKGAVYFQAPGEDYGEFEDGKIKFKQMEEGEILEKFWQGAKHYQSFISFNGRSFDVPFLMIRSAVNKVRPSKNLLSNRYLNSQLAGSKHIDLLEQFSFYGAVYRKPSLHLCCRTFGIESPKSGGITGDDVAKLFKNKKYKDIAKYNVGDLVATKKLYEYWRDYIHI